MCLSLVLLLVSTRVACRLDRRRAEKQLTQPVEFKLTASVKKTRPASVALLNENVAPEAAAPVKQPPVTPRSQRTVPQPFTLSKSNRKRAADPLEEVQPAKKARVQPPQTPSRGLTENRPPAQEQVAEAPKSAKPQSVSFGAKLSCRSANLI